MFNIFRVYTLVIFGCLISHSGWSYNLFSTENYKPNIEFSLKSGNQRDLLRVGGLAPIHQWNNHFLFLNIFGMLDSKQAQEGNIGIGYRRLSNQYILGTYTFYDIRKTLLNNTIPQLTFGFEYMAQFFEGRFNVYLPSNRTYISGSKKIVEYPNLARIQQNNIISEKALKGFDLEMGGNIPRAKFADLYLTYYFFHSTQSKDVHGVRIRGSLHVNSYVKLEGEWSYDGLRKSNYLFGLKLNWPAKEEHSLTDKMTKMVVRDIDIVVDQKGKKTNYILSQGDRYSEEPVHYNEENDEEVGQALKSLGLNGKSVTWVDVRKKFKKQILKRHPDKFTDVTKFNDARKIKLQQLLESYRQLEKYFKGHPNHENRNSEVSHRNRRTISKTMQKTRKIKSNKLVIEPGRIINQCRTTMTLVPPIISRQLANKLQLLALRGKKSKRILMLARRRLSHRTGSNRGVKWFVQSNKVGSGSASQIKRSNCMIETAPSSQGSETFTVPNFLVNSAHANGGSIVSVLQMIRRLVERGEVERAREMFKVQFVRHRLKPKPPVRSHGRVSIERQLTSRDFKLQNFTLKGHYMLRDNIARFKIIEIQKGAELPQLRMIIRELRRMGRLDRARWLEIEFNVSNKELHSLLARHYLVNRLRKQMVLVTMV